MMPLTLLKVQITVQSKRCSLLALGEGARLFVLFHTTGRPNTVSRRCDVLWHVAFKLAHLPTHILAQAPSHTLWQGVPKHYFALAQKFHWWQVFSVGGSCGTDHFALPVGHCVPGGPRFERKSSHCGGCLPKCWAGHQFTFSQGNYSYWAKRDRTMYSGKKVHLSFLVYSFCYFVPSKTQTKRVSVQNVHMCCTTFYDKILLSWMYLFGKNPVICIFFLEAYIFMA